MIQLDDKNWYDGNIIWQHAKNVEILFARLLIWQNEAIKIIVKMAIDWYVDNIATCRNIV